MLYTYRAYRSLGNTYMYKCVWCYGCIFRTIIYRQFFAIRYILVLLWSSWFLTIFYSNWSCMNCWNILFRCRQTTQRFSIHLGCVTTSKIFLQFCIRLLWERVAGLRISPNRTIPVWSPCLYKERGTFCIASANPRPQTSTSEVRVLHTGWIVCKTRSTPTARHWSLIHFSKKHTSVEGML